MLKLHLISDTNIVEQLEIPQMCHATNDERSCFQKLVDGDGVGGGQTNRAVTVSWTTDLHSCR